MYPKLLRAFRHPLVIFSIVLLLLNDHLLKAASPSWLTGKLSDFAGLFFFPFLLGAALEGAGAVLRRPREAGAVTSRRALGLAILLTALMFTGIKILPVANQFAAELLSTILRQTIRIALDPTDLMALPVMFCAWKVWQQAERVLQPTPPGRLALAVFSLGALASVASIECPPYFGIYHLAVSGNILYTQAGSSWASTSQAAAIASEDGGKRWYLVENAPAEIIEQFAAVEEIPVTLCDPAAPLTCYRIDGQPQVEESQDGGKTWQVAWSIPAGRERFMYYTEKGIGCRKQVELRTFDMALLPGKDGPTVTVAMGNQGLLIRTPGGDWQRTGFSYCTEKCDPADAYCNDKCPTPTEFAASSLTDMPRVLQSEILTGLAIGFLVYILGSLVGGLYLLWQGGPEGKAGADLASSSTRLSTSTVIAIVTAYLLTIQGSLMYGLLSFTNCLATLLFVGLPVAAMGLCIWAWIRAGRQLSPEDPYYRAQWGPVVVGMLIWIISSVGFSLWAFGTIPIYETALAIVWAACAAITAAGGLWMWREMRSRVVRLHEKRLHEKRLRETRDMLEKQE